MEDRFRARRRKDWFHDRVPDVLSFSLPAVWVHEDKEPSFWLDPCSRDQRPSAQAPVTITIKTRRTIVCP